MGGGGGMYFYLFSGHNIVLRPSSCSAPFLSPGLLIYTNVMEISMLGKNNTLHIYVLILCVPLLCTSLMSSSVVNWVQSTN